MAEYLSLLSTTSRVETPFIKVTIGEYTFGVYERNNLNINDKIKEASIKYPNYIQSLNITKINGKVNQYSLSIEYPLTSKDDPNFFEKVFSSVSDSRKITFSYGDLSTPTYLYKEEEAIITKVTTGVSANSAVLSYRVDAISTGIMATVGVYNFDNNQGIPIQPSERIKELLYNSKYGLLEVFPGMTDKDLVEQKQLIPHNDKAVILERKYCSVWDYLKYLIDSMQPVNKDNNVIYAMSIVDDITGEFEGAYFKLQESNSKLEDIDTYVIDFGWPGNNVVTNIDIQDDEGYSILYKYSSELNPASYTQRIDDNGNLVDIYAPVYSSNNAEHDTNSEDTTWWSKVTQYPINASVTIKGLLRSAMLMTYVKLNVSFYGKLHTSSGLYIVTQQQDSIGYDGFKTTLSLTRINKKEEEAF